MRNNSEKLELILHTSHWEKGGFMLSLKDEPAYYQLVGEVMAHQGYDG